GQIALASLLAQHHDIVPIPGSRRPATVRANLVATSVRISADDVAHLGALFDATHIKGGRYGALNVLPCDTED
ncbi:aldo/keto reductase, partial [Streptomyces tendae]